MQIDNQTRQGTENENVTKADLKCPIADNPKYAEFDLNDAPHLLIYGMTGTGKTTYIQSVLATLIEKNDSKLLKVIIYDSSMSEYNRFKKVSHLFCQILTNKQDFSNALEWLEMIVRTKGYLADIIMIIDDFADIATEPELVERVSNLLREGRAARVHFIISTSMPYAKVLSFEIKANIPYVISFAAPSKMVSRMVLGTNGAETLGIPGEIYFKKTSDIRKYTAFTMTPDRIQDIITVISKTSSKSNDSAGSTSSILPITDFDQSNDEFMKLGIENDPLYDEIAEYIVTAQKASTSLLQRRFGIGYDRAARFIHSLEEKSIIGPVCGSAPRKVLMDLDKYNQVFKGIPLPQNDHMQLTNQQKIVNDRISLEVVNNKLQVTEHATSFDQLSILPINEIEEAKKHYPSYNLQYIHDIALTYTTTGETIQKLIFHSPSFFGKQKGYIAIDFKETTNKVEITLSGETYESKTPRNTLKICFNEADKDEYYKFIKTLSNDTKLQIYDK